MRRTPSEEIHTARFCTLLFTYLIGDLCPSLRIFQFLTAASIKMRGIRAGGKTTTIRKLLVDLPTHVRRGSEHELDSNSHGSQRPHGWENPGSLHHNSALTDWYLVHWHKENKENILMFRLELVIYNHTKVLPLKIKAYLVMRG